MRKHHSGDGDSKIVLPITPMLDMTFQLLFFFILNFNPADMEGAVDLALPVDRGVAVGQPGPPMPPAEPDFPADLTVVVRSALGGEVSALSVRNLEGKDSPVDGLAGLKAFLAGRKDKGRLKLQGDAKLNVRGLIEVMDACRAAGFTDLGFVHPD